MEDNFADVVRKAQRGMSFSDHDLATQAGITEERLARVKAEHYDAAALEKLAGVLGLSARALVALPEYQPAPVEVPRLAVCRSPFGGMWVNAYLAWDAEGRAAAFDTGTDCRPILEILRAKKLTLCGIFITHTHSDHVSALDQLREASGAPVFREEIACGNLWIEPRQTWGHTQDGMSYVVHGLDCLAVMVGDALFAGSMGGGLVSYADALRTNREQILTLPPETVLCPGHGPMTTVGEERLNNPFFA